MSKKEKLENLKTSIKEKAENFDTTAEDPIIQQTFNFFEDNVKDEESEEQLVNQGI